MCRANIYPIFSTEILGLVGNQRLTGILWLPTWFFYFIFMFSREFHRAAKAFWCACACACVCVCVCVCVLWVWSSWHFVNVVGVVLCVVLINPMQSASAPKLGSCIRISGFLNICDILHGPMQTVGFAYWICHFFPAPLLLATRVNRGKGNFPGLRQLCMLQVFF